MAENWEELRVSNDCKDDAEELRRRMAEEGYLFFKKLQNPDKLLALRREMTRVFYDAGWLVAGTDPMDGIARSLAAMHRRRSGILRRLPSDVPAGIVPSLPQSPS